MEEVMPDDHSKSQHFRMRQPPTEHFDQESMWLKYTVGCVYIRDQSPKQNIDNCRNRQ